MERAHPPSFKGPSHPAVMPNEGCPQSGCGESTQEIFVEEGTLNGETQLFPVSGARWCPRDGIIETTAMRGSLGPTHIGPFIRGELDREYAQRGERVWRTARVGEVSEIMARTNPPSLFRLRVAFVRWHGQKGEIIPLQDLGSGYVIRPESVDRTHGSTLPLDIEPYLKSRDDMLRQPRSVE